MTHCTGCGAPIDALRCDYCGHVNDESPGETASAGGGMAPCPRCEGAASLSTTNVGGVAIGSCPRCSGLWITAEALQSVIHQDESMAQVQGARGQTRQGSPETKVSYIRCPSCREFMARKNYERVSGVIVDVCPDHGVWLDAGELEALRLFALSGGRTLADKAHRAKEELDAELQAERRSGFLTPGGSRRTVLHDLRGIGLF